MKMRSFALCLLAIIGLSACGDKSADPTATPTPLADTAPTPQNSAATTPSADTAFSNPVPTESDALLIKSPFMDFMVSTHRALVKARIRSELELTPEQEACLMGPAGNPNYIQILDPYVKDVLSDEEIQQADVFFATDAGRKFSEIILMATDAKNLSSFVEPTDSEKAEITKAMLQPFFTKMQAKSEAMSEEEVMAILQSLMQKELARCQIAPTSQ